MVSDWCVNVTDATLRSSDPSLRSTSNYNAFGNITNDTDPTANPFRYVGQLGYLRHGGPATPVPPEYSGRMAYGNCYGGRDCLMLLGARWYDPVIGRFMTQDPIGYFGDMNLYGYTANNPVNMVDTGGEWAPTWHQKTSEKSARRAGFGRYGGNFSGIGHWAYQADCTTLPGHEPHFGDFVGYADLMMYDALDNWEKGCCDKALEALGLGLHAKQDRWSHGGYFSPRFTHIFLNWIYHMDDPKVHPVRARNAERDTLAYLEDFIDKQRELKTKGAQKCRVLTGLVSAKPPKPARGAKKGK